MKIKTFWGCMLLIFLPICSKGQEALYPPAFHKVEALIGIGEAKLDKNKYEQAQQMANRANGLLNDASFVADPEKLMKLEIETYLLLANINRNLGETDTFNAYLDSSEMCLAYIDDNILEGRKNYLRALAYSQFDQTEKSDLSYYRNIKLLRNEIKPEALKLLSNSLYSLGRNKMDAGQTDSALYFMGQSYEYRKKAFGAASPEIALPYLGLGHVYSLSLNFWPEALKNYSKAVEQSSKDFTDPAIQNLHFFGLLRKAEMLSKLHRYEEALSVLNELRAFKDEHLEVELSPSAEISLYSSLGETARNLGHYEAALSFRKKEQELWEANKESLSPNVRYNILNSLAICYQNLGRTEKAEEYFQKLYDFLRERLPEGHGVFSLYFYNYGYFLEEHGQDERAIDFYLKSLDNLSEPSDYLAAYVNVCIKLAKHYLQNEEFESGLKYANKSLNANHHSYDHPENEDLVASEAYNLEAFFKGLEVKGDISLARFEKEQSIELKEDALQAYLQIIGFIEESRSGYLLEEDQLYLTEEFSHVADKAVACLRLLYEKTEDQHYLYKAFSLVERAKNGIMRERILQNYAMDFAGLPDSLLVKEGEMRSRINQKETEKNALIRENAQENEQKIHKLEGKVRNLKGEYQGLVQSIEDNHPEYFALRYEQPIIDASQIKELLKRHFPDRALVSYFYTRDELHSFVVRPDEIFWHTVETSDITQYTNQFNQGIRNHNAPEFFEASHKLYEKLIAPLESQLPEKLVIIPYQKLNLLSFDALTYEIPENIQSYNQAGYLLENHQVAYGFSANLFFEILNYREKERAREPIAAFAPWSNRNDDTPIATRSESGFLYYSGKEVESLKELFFAVSFEGPDATKSRFLEVADQFQVIHLATHGKVNVENPFYSSLYFSSEEGEKDSLTVSELYNTRLNSSLTVLGACETGLGEDVKGEGVINLTRGFAYAGAPNLVYSHWNIPDRATSEVIGSFYQHLKDGNERDASLRNAKQEYLSNADANQANPFFWAGLSFVGDPENQESFDSHNWFYWIFGGLFLTSILLLVLRSRH